MSLAGRRSPPEPGTDDPLFEGRVPEAAACQLAVVMAWLTEAQLETLEQLRGRSRASKAELARQQSICDEAVRQCFELGLRPGVRGLRGQECGRLAQRLAELLAES